MSSRRPIRSYEITNPERILNNLLRDYVDGKFDDYGFLFRASVVKIDHQGGALEKDPKYPPNPRNSIQARVITNDRDKDLTDEELPVYWPLFTHDVMPLKEGEHVYVIFENNNDKTHGLWLGRIAEPNTVNSINLVPGSKKYLEDDSNELTAGIGAEKAVQGSDVELTTAQPSSEFTSEKVPAFKARVGDRVLEGSNNSMIVLGRDRPNSTTSGEKFTAGTIDLVAGRKDADNMNQDTDLSRIYISMNTDIDKNFGVNVGPAAGPTPSVGLKSDEIRIVARKGFKIVVADKLSIVVEDDGKMTIETTGDVKLDAPNVVVASSAIKLGSDASIEPLVLGNMLVTAVLQPLLTALAADAPAAIAFGIPGVVQLPATAGAAPAALAALAQILSKKHTTE